MPATKKRLLLINPLNELRKGFVRDVSSRYPPLSLGIIAALTPDNWRIKIIDENFTPHRFREADLVGITAFTANAPRAYVIAREYRSKGVPVIMGGIHASMLPEEAQQFADTVVSGEAESIWSRVIHDFEDGNLARRYTGELMDLDRQPIPRHDLFHPAYVFSSVQTSRGCPYQCEFCTVTAFNGSRYRERRVEDVLQELEILPRRNLFFIDDNILGYGKNSRERVLSLFKGMIERNLNLRWFSQADLNFADDEELIYYAAKSGCRLIELGVEVETEEGLREFNKRINLKHGVDSYQRSFRKIQKHGISVLGTFILGLDSDHPGDIDRRTRFMMRCGVDAVQATIMTPLPGTRLFARLCREDRLGFSDFPDDWRHYHAMDVVFQPHAMTASVLSGRVRSCWTAVYSYRALAWRFLRALIRTRRFGAAAWSLMSNYHYRRIVFEKEIAVPPAEHQDIRS